MASSEKQVYVFPVDGTLAMLAGYTSYKGTL